MEGALVLNLAKKIYPITASLPNGTRQRKRLLCTNGFWIPMLLSQQLVL